MPTTANYGFYSPPLTGVTPNVPRDNLTLANAVDVALKAEETARIAGDVTLIGSRTQVAALATTSGAVTIVPYDTSVSNEIPWDSTNNRFTVPTAGYYLVSAGCVFAANATSVRSIRIFINGTETSATQAPATSAASSGCTISGGYKLAASDTVQIRIHQSSGGSLSTAGAGPYNFVTVTRVGL